MSPVIEILPDGTWIDITSDHRAESGLSLGRGRKAYTDATSSRLDFVLKNPGGKYSSDRPGTPYYRKLGRGTQIRVTEPLAADTFTRTVSNGWGTAEFPAPAWTFAGLAWQNGSGSASDYAVTGGAGRHTLTTTVTARQSRLTVSYRKTVVTAAVTIGALATGASARASVVARKNDAGTAHYRAELEFATTGDVVARIIRLGGPGDAILTNRTIGTYAAAAKWWIQFVSVGPQLYMRAWPDGSPEPTAVSVLAEDPHFRTGQIALRSVRDSGNTNASLTFDWDSVRIASPDFWGEIWTMRPMNGEGGLDLTMTVHAAGILQRLSNTDKPLRSSLYRSLSTGSLYGFLPKAYWPLEDGQQATQLEQAIAGVRPGNLTGQVRTGSDSSLPGSAPLPVLSAGGLLSGVIPQFGGFDPATDDWTLIWLMKISDAPNAETVLARFSAGTNVTSYELAMDAAGNLILRGPKAFQLNLDAYTFTVQAPYDQAHQNFSGSPSLWGRWVILEMINNPPDEIFLQWTDATTSAHYANVSYTDAALVWQQPNGVWTFHGPISGSLGVGHLSAYDNFASLTVDAASGYAGERARTRISRLGVDEGIEMQTVGTGSELMGPQKLANLVEIWEDAAEADFGPLTESRHVLGAEYRARQHLYNQYPHLVLDCSGGELNDGLSPVRDDQRGLANEVTATRAGGTPEMFTIPDSDVFHLTSQEPPLGVGLVRASVSPNVQTDRHAHQQAAWHAHLRASRAPRYEQVVVKLNTPQFRINPQLTADARALGEGDVIRLDAAPALIEATLPPGPRELIVQGLEHYRDGVEDRITLNTTPADDWRVWCMDTGGSQIEVAADSDDTALKVSTLYGPPWKTSPDPGWSIQGMTGGEAMFVTGCTTDTPAAGNVGTVATGNNASVVPALPASITPDVGQSLFILAAIRNSGAGVPNAPAGWSTVVDNGNMRLFHRFYVTGDVAPTVIFSGGVANADTMARMFAFTGVSPYAGGAFGSAKGLKRTPGTSDQLNASAQNIAYPAYFVHRDNCVVIIAAWKQDDWTGVAPPAGFTELIDNSTTTGDDSGIALYYQVQSTATNITAGSLVVTGGASAISRATVVALRPLQTLVVERAINGISGNLLPAELLHVWNHGAVPL